MITNPIVMPTSIDLTGLPEPVIQRVKQIVQQARDTQDESTGFLSRPRPSREESKRLLDLMSSRSTQQSLPADFSRSDIYDEHD